MRALPEQLLNSLRPLPGFDEKGFLDIHQQEERLTSIRLNPFKKADITFPGMAQVPWCRDGFYLQQRPSFTLDPLFHAGAYYVQEPGSMFLEEAVRQSVDLSLPLRVLDVSAAPGGKSTLLSSLITPESLLVANEIVKSRAQILSYNLSKWGTINTVVTNNEPEKFGRLQGFFDLMVVDAPCSGSGLFRKQPEAIDEWSPEHVTACSLRQKRILDDILPALKEGGILIYSTCSYSAEENEEVVKGLVKSGMMELVPLVIAEDWGIVDSGLGYRFYPHLTRSEGFFLAVLKRVGGNETGTFRKKNKAVELSKTELEIASDFFPDTQGEAFKVIMQLHYSTSAVKEFLVTGQEHFYFRKAGVVLGEIKGRDFVPNHELALVSAMPKKVHLKEFGVEDALRFLRKENVDPGEKISGFSLITHQKLGLGWAKILDKRMNNYLPNEYRILK